MAFNFKELKEGESFTGIYSGYYKNVGKFSRSIYGIKDVETNEVAHFWADVVLKMEMYGIAFRSLICITYNGITKSDKSNFMVKQYKVKILEPPKSGKVKPKEGGAVSEPPKEEKKK